MQIKNVSARLLLPASLVVLAGCSSMASHDKHASAVQATASVGGLPAALAQHEASVTTDEGRKGLLFNLERGELLYLNKRYADSIDALSTADVKVKEWEETAKTNPSKLLGTVGAALISERLKVYEGQDYEKVFLTTRLAVNRLTLGDLQGARVDIKRTHEREAVIAEFRSKETAKAEEEAKSKGASTSGQSLNGYPVETLDDPEVLSLKNGYQNALSHYLSGWVYEVLNESGLAAPGYRKAIELRPGAKMLEEGLRGLDQRTSFTHKLRQRKTDVLFLVEAGDAPARVSQAFTLPVPVGTSVRSVSISYPVIRPSTDPMLGAVQVGGQQLSLDKVVDLNVMARRVLKDEMPGMIFRNFTRAVAKGVVQNELEKRAGMFGALVGMVASAATEQADDRMWRMLPGRIYVARGYMEPGEHTVTVDGRSIGASVKVDGQYALVPIRLYGNQVVVGQVSQFGQLPAVAQPVAQSAAPAPEAKPQAEAATKKVSAPAKPMPPKKVPSLPELKGGQATPAAKGGL